jgi:hypothetical protein
MIEILDRVYSAWKRGESVLKLNQDYVQQLKRRPLSRDFAKAFAWLLEEKTQPEYAQFAAVANQVVYSATAIRFNGQFGLLC